MHSSPPASPSRTMPSGLRRILAALSSVFSGISIRRRERSLRICESLPLGDKRFLAVVQFEGRRFLIGATNQSISLLDRLDSLSPQRRKREHPIENSFLNGVH